MLRMGPFLKVLMETVEDAIQEGENEGWHHAEDGSERWIVYNRLLTARTEIARRLARYEYAKARTAFFDGPALPP